MTNGAASGTVGNGGRSKISWLLKLAMLLIVFLSLGIFVMQPSKYFYYKPLTRYNGIKAFLACPEETNTVQFHGHSNEASNTVSTRCAELSRTLQTSKQIINKILLVNTEKIDEGTKFADICDSLDKIEILMALQSQFNVTVSENIVPNITTVGDAVGIIEELRSKDGVSA